MEASRWKQGHTPELAQSGSRCQRRQRRLMVAVHQPNLRLFGDSDSRGQYGYRRITDARTTSLWRMTLGFAPGSSGTLGSRAGASSG